MLKPINELFIEYYNKYKELYFQKHNGLKYSNVSDDEKESYFLEEHCSIIRQLWDKSLPLKRYSYLYKCAHDAEKNYEDFIDARRAEIHKRMSNNKRFSTEICSVFDKYYVKVYFLDDGDAEQAKVIVENLNEVKNVNITESKSRAHPGKTLTVYQKPMVAPDQCEKEVIEALNRFFNNDVLGKMHASSEAKFADIEKHILKYLSMAVATIDVCVAWFTNDELRDKLLEKANEGVKVRVILYRDGVNHAKGVDLTGLNYKEYRGERGGIMHDKFCVIDNVHTICGSYNWTRNAENKNDEDAAFHWENYKFASAYTRRFNQIWERDGKAE